MEVVRGDWTATAKQVQLEMYRRLFAGRPVGEYLANVVKRVRTGELDAMLVYRKSLRKASTNTPPRHAPRRGRTQVDPALGSHRPLRHDRAGPEPVDEVQNALDREHYVIKQVQPVVEPVLATLGLDFESVIGDRRQLDLLGGQR